MYFNLPTMKLFRPGLGLSLLLVSSALGFGQVSPPKSAPAKRAPTTQIIIRLTEIASLPPVLPKGPEGSANIEPRITPFSGCAHYLPNIHVIASAADIGFQDPRRASAQTQLDALNQEANSELAKAQSARQLPPLMALNGQIPFGTERWLQPDFWQYRRILWKDDAQLARFAQYVLVDKFGANGDRKFFAKTAAQQFHLCVGVGFSNLQSANFPVFTSQVQYVNLDIRQLAQWNYGLAVSPYVVMAHELSHVIFSHYKKLVSRTSDPKGEPTPNERATELQADCGAGMIMSQLIFNSLMSTSRSETENFVSQVLTAGRNPKTDTHGSGEARLAAYRKGLDIGANTTKMTSAELVRVCEKAFSLERTAAGALKP